MADATTRELASAAAFAPSEVIRLWPEGAPRNIPDVGPETVFTAPDAAGADSPMLRNVSEPSLAVYAPDPSVANGVGVIVCPGGGWRILAWEHEGVDVARWLTSRGYCAFLLKYRVMGTPPDPDEFARASAALRTRSWDAAPAAKAPRALSELVRDKAMSFAREVAADDGARALAIVRDGASRWGVAPDRIGMIGFSAGAFLTVDVALGAEGSALAFIAPIYGGETGGKSIPTNAPALFTVIAQDDRMLFKVVEGLYADWSNADRPAEIHVFARGGHGFGMTRRGLPVDRWIDLFGDWLADRGLA